MPNRNPIRIYCLLALLLIGMAGVLIQLVRITGHPQALQAGTRQGKYHIQIPISSGIVYDRFRRPINQSEGQIIALVHPTAKSAAELLSVVSDASDLSSHFTSGTPFICKLNAMPSGTDDLWLFEGRTKRNGAVPAQHIIGYRQNGTGVSGLEATFYDVLSKYDCTADITLSVDAHGTMLAGGDTDTEYSGQKDGGIITTLDLDIQKIADTALQQALPSAGAAIVLDCRCGDVLALSSSPVYNPDKLSEALDDEGKPFLNRALCAYSVGSVFKLAVASAALESGCSTEFLYECTGSVEVYGKLFRCHCAGGHGLLNMQNALTKSCNPYFITLTGMVPSSTLLHTAELLGFGHPIVLSPGISADAGYLQSENALKIPAEKANLSFGQGKLLATPLHIAAMTACIANHGIYTEPRLVIGETDHGKSILSENSADSQRALLTKTADTVRDMMIGVLKDASGSNGIPSNTTAGGKTSTAQTGQYDKNGNELCHAWMTGFFPAEEPKYAVTVMIENGGSGNDAAAPVFRRIIEEIARLQS